MMKGNVVLNNADEVVVGGIPIVFFKSEERLDEILAACERIGVFIANPHTVHLEEGGRHPNIADKRAFKADVDPAALLNPGKMKTYPVNPFRREPAVYVMEEAQLPIVELRDVDKRYGEAR